MKYCRPYGDDRVDLLALSYTNEILGRNFQAIKSHESDRFQNIVRDMDAIAKLEEKGIMVQNL